VYYEKMMREVYISFTLLKEKLFWIVQVKHGIVSS